MALKHLPQAERLLSGKLTAELNDSDLTASVDTPPSVDKLPTYFEFEPGTDNVELVRIIGVSSGVITMERGLNNGGTGLPHLVNSAYKQKFTSRHFEAIADAVEKGFLTLDETYDFAKVDSDTFTITGSDETAYFTKGRVVRLNGSVISMVVSSTYLSNVTTVNILNTTVPTTITTVEFAIGPLSGLDIATLFGLATLTGVETFTNKTLTSPKINENVALTAKSSELNLLAGKTSLSSFWSVFSGAYASATTIVISGTDLTSIMKKGVVLKWQKSDNTFKTGMVISSVFSTDTTITIVGSTVESGDKNFYYAAEKAKKETFILPGNQATGTNVGKTFFPESDIYKLSVDARVITAGTTNPTTYDVNDDGTTIITTKPSIASGGTSDLDNVCDTPTTAIAANSLVTVDIDAASTTQAIDGYIDLFYYPTEWVNRA